MSRNKKLEKALISVFFILIVILYISSTTWFRLKLADHYNKKRDNKQLIALYEKILRKESVDPKYRSLSDGSYFEIHLILAGLYFSERDITRSVAVLKDLKNAYYRPSFYGTLHDPDDRRRASFCLSAAGFTDMAIVQLLEYLQLRDNDSLEHYRLGLMYERKKEYEDAITQFEKVIEICNKSTDKPKHLSNAYFRLGRIAEMSRGFEQALGCYDKAVQLNNNNFLVYHYLRCLYEDLGRHSEAEAIENILIGLKPDYQIDRKFDDIVLIGYYLDEHEFEMFNDGEVVFIWNVRAHSGPFSTLNKAFRRYRIGDIVYEIKDVKNLVENFGFEGDFLGEGFPRGWETDYYKSSLAAHQMTIDNGSNDKNTQCLLLDNLREDNTSCQSDYIALSEGHYLQCGWIKTSQGSAYFGSLWFDDNKRPVSYDYAANSVRSGDWTYHSKVWDIHKGTGYCRLLLANSWTGGRGKAYFDNVLFIRVDPI